MNEIFWPSVQKARKEYFCDNCCNQILQGETYHREVWVPREGSFHVMRRHEYPSICPSNLSDEIYAEMLAEEKVAIAVTMVVVEEVVEVLKIALNGSIVSEREVRRAPKLVYGEPEKEKATEIYDQTDDIEFPF